MTSPGRLTAEDSALLERTLSEVASRLVPFYPSLLGFSQGTLEQTVAGGFGDMWHLACATGTEHISAGSARSWVHYVVLTDGLLWASTWVKLDPTTNAIPVIESPWPELGLADRVRHVTHAIRNNTALGIGYDGLMRAVVDKATPNGGRVRHSVWAPHAGYLMTTADYTPVHAAQVESGRFLFTLAGDTDRYHALDRPY